MARKIICHVVGGLGNQLFMYAAARAMAWRDDAELVLETGLFRRDVVYHRELLLESFRGPRALRQVDFGRGLRRYWHRATFELGQQLPERWRTVIREGEPPRYQPELLVPRQGSVRMMGGWQSERYFDDYRSELLADLAFGVELSTATKQLAQEIEAEAEPVAVHLRAYRDVPNPNERRVLPRSYVEAACGRIRDEWPKAKLFLFADEPEHFRDVSKALGAHRWVTHNQVRGNAGAIEDLYLMSRCRHFVVANSSLSWWGAWLSQQRWGMAEQGSAGDRMIIAPASGIFNRDFVPAWWIAQSIGSNLV